MSTWIIKTQTDVAQLCEALGRRKKPFTVEVTKKGSKRSIAQNRLQREWLNEAAEQLQEYTAEEYRGYCKLHFGCQILYHEDEEFAAAFDKVIRPLDYEQKLQAMMIPLDLPVTRRFTTDQHTRYLNLMYQHFTEQGCILTQPPSDWSI